MSEGETTGRRLRYALSNDIADTPNLADANKNTSIHVFSNIFNNCALFSHLTRGMIPGKPERNLNWSYRWYKSRRSATRTPLCRPLCRTAHPPTIPRPSRPPAPRAMPISEIRRPLACKECHTEVRGRVVGSGVVFGGHVGAESKASGATAHFVLLVFL